MSLKMVVVLDKHINMRCSICKSEVRDNETYMKITHADRTDSSNICMECSKVIASNMVSYGKVGGNWTPVRCAACKWYGEYGKCNNETFNEHCQSDSEYHGVEVKPEFGCIFSEHTSKKTHNEK